MVSGAIEATAANPEQNIGGVVMMRTLLVCRRGVAAAVLLFASVAVRAWAQDPAQPPAPPAAQPAQAPAIGGQPPVNAAVNGFGVGGFNGPGMGGGGLNGGIGPDPFGAGGAASADFDSLIDLITSTVEQESWQENGTGEGEIQPFPTGVWVDATGNLRFGERADARAQLTAVRERGAAAAVVPPRDEAGAKATERDARQASKLRYVSLPRLEAAIAQRQNAHQPLDAAMLTLAGLQRVQYVLVYPETGDLVLAGPAGDWRATRDGLVDADTGRPLVRLDDLLTLWRRQQDKGSAAFGCSIVPRQEALARTQEFLAASAAQPIEPGERRDWLAQLRDTLGVQDVEYYNIDPNTRIAGLLLSADYHMKLVGMGLAEAVPGVKSYLATVRLGPGGQAPPMAILRWWFSIPMSTVEATAAGDAFALPANCVQVLSENEMLAARGERVHTGQSDELNSQFARSFTAEFEALAAKYPVYAQLARVFELSLALAVIEKEGLAAKVAWTPSLLLDNERLRLPRLETPKGVQTVINHRVIGGRHIIAGISGGVWVDGGKSLAVSAASGEVATTLASMRKAPAAPSPAVVNDAEATPAIAWWWD